MEKAPHHEKYLSFECKMSPQMEEEDASLNLIGYKVLLNIIVVKLREREGQRVDLGRSLKGHLWMVDGGWWYTFP